VGDGGVGDVGGLVNSKRADLCARISAALKAELFVW